MIHKFKSLKFYVFIFYVIVSITMLYLGKIVGRDFIDFSKFLIGTFVVGNVVSKFARVLDRKYRE